MFFAPNLSIRRSFIASTVRGLTSSFCAISWAVNSMQMYLITSLSRSVRVISLLSVGMALVLECDFLRRMRLTKLLR